MTWERIALIAIATNYLIGLVIALYVNYIVEKSPFKFKEFLLLLGFAQMGIMVPLTLFDVIDWN